MSSLITCMSVCLCALLAYEVCGGPGVNIGPLAPVERPPPQRDRSPCERSQAVSIHLQMNSALFHQQTPPSLPSSLLPPPPPCCSPYSSASFFFFPLPLAPSFPSSLTLSASFFLFVPFCHEICDRCACIKTTQKIICSLGSASCPYMPVPNLLRSARRRRQGP